MSEAPGFVRCHPQLFVTDLERALAFFSDRLGFSTAYAWGDPPFYALVERAGVGLNLRHVDTPPVSAERRAADDLLSVTIVVEDVAALHAELQGRGAPFHQSIERQDWGAWDFIVKDPDGNLIHFASVAEEPVRA